jgi:hypothetical protein
MESKEPYESGMLNQILIGYPCGVDQRAASVAASMICWLGTNVGKCFLMLGAEIRNSTSCLDAYAAAWGASNLRKFGMNSGARQIEFLVRSHDDQNQNVFPEVSVRDLEVLEQVAIWLGREEGQAFLQGCEDEIERRRQLESLAFECAAGRGDSLYARKIMDKFAVTD